MNIITDEINVINDDKVIDILCDPENLKHLTTKQFSQAKALLTI